MNTDVDQTEKLNEFKLDLPKAYSGSQKFLFLSYSHRDIQWVRNDIREFNKKGARLWYDEGLVPGEKWFDHVKTVLNRDNCVGAVFCISKKSVKSESIKREIALVTQQKSLRNDFKIITIHYGGYPLSEYLKIVNTEEIIRSYKELFHDDLIFIPRQLKVSSSKHIYSCLFTFDNWGAIDEKCRSYLETALFNINIQEGEVHITGYNGKSKRLIIPASIEDKPVVSIESGAFENLNFLEDVIIEDGIETIGNFSFSKCVNLQKITLPHKLKTIGYESFSHCEKLKYISIPPYVCEIKGLAFYCCVSLKEIFFDENTRSPDLILGYSLFSQCVKLTKIKLPERTKSLGDYIFGGCAFSKMVIPSNVVTLGKDAFVCNNRLNTIEFEGNSITISGNSAFSLCPNLKNVVVSCDLDPHIADHYFKGLNISRVIKLKNLCAHHEKITWKQDDRI